MSDQTKKINDVSGKVGTDGIVFFGTSALSIYVIDELMSRGIRPTAIVTVPDRPAGRKMIMTPPPLKVWAEAHGIPCLQFEKLNQDAVDALSNVGSNIGSNIGSSAGSNEHSNAGSRPKLFIVASYGKIIPQAVLDIPAHGALNVHPSVLPKLRGATPLQTSIMLDMQETGVTIIKMDKDMDHGPVVAVHQEKITPWPQTYTELERHLAVKGAEILAEALPAYMSGKLVPSEQNHADSTFTKKIEKTDGLIELAEVLELVSLESNEASAAASDTVSNAISNIVSGEQAWSTFLKYNALIEWPGLYFFAIKTTEDGTKRNIRVKIKDASWNTALAHMEILRVIPEGKKEMGWKEFENYMRG